jgi:hypothetical protein
MPYRAMALVAVSIMTLSGSALAQKEPTTDSKNLNSSRSNVDLLNATGNGGNAYGGAHAPDVKTVKGSNSNTSDRMGGGPGKKAAGTAAKTPTSDRMGAGGGGKGAVGFDMNGPNSQNPAKR